MRRQLERNGSVFQIIIGKDRTAALVQRNIRIVGIRLRRLRDRRDIVDHAVQTPADGHGSVAVILHAAAVAGNMILPVCVQVCAVDHIADGGCFRILVDGGLEGPGQGCGRSLKRRGRQERADTGLVIKDTDLRISGERAVLIPVGVTREMLTVGKGFKLLLRILFAFIGTRGGIFVISA